MCPRYCHTVILLSTHVWGYGWWVASHVHTWSAHVHGMSMPISWGPRQFVWNHHIWLHPQTLTTRAGLEGVTGRSQRPCCQPLHEVEVEACLAGITPWHCVISHRVCLLHKNSHCPIRFCRDTQTHDDNDDDDQVYKKSAKLSYTHFYPGLSKTILYIPS